MTLPFRVGRWRGTGWTEVERGRVPFEQQETVRSPLDGELVTIEGRANDPGHPDDVRFRAFAVATVDAATGEARWRAYSSGNGPNYRWEFEAAPGVRMRFDGTAEEDRRREIGHRSTDGGTTWVPTFEMELRGPHH